VYFWCLDYSAKFQAACLDLSVATIGRKAARNFYLFCTLPPTLCHQALIEITFCGWKLEQNGTKSRCKVLNFQHHTFWVIRTRMTSNGLLSGHFAVLPKEKDKKIIPRNRPCPFLRKFGRPLCRPIVIIVGSNVEWIKGSGCSTHLFCCSRPNNTMIRILWKSYFLFWLLLLLCELVITFDIWKSTILFSCKTEKTQESSCYFSELLMLLFSFFRECHIWKNSHWFQGQPASQLESWQFFYCMHDALGKWAVLQLLLLGSELQKISMIIRHKKCFNTV